MIGGLLRWLWNWGTGAPGPAPATAAGCVHLTALASPSVTFADPTSPSLSLEILSPSVTLSLEEC